MGIQLSDILGDPGTLFSEREWVVIFVENMLMSSEEVTKEEILVAIEELSKYENMDGGLSEVERDLLEYLSKV